MIRTIITPDKNQISIKIPDKFIGKKIEAIAFSLDDPSDDVIYTEKSYKSFSSIKLQTRGYKLLLLHYHVTGIYLILKTCRMGKLLKID